MRKILALLVMALALPFAADARPLMAATAGSGESITLHDTKGDCPSGVTNDGTKWDARVATYLDPRDGEKQTGCYVIDEKSDPKVVIVIFKEGSYAGQPLYISARMFKPEV